MVGIGFRLDGDAVAHTRTLDGVLHDTAVAELDHPVSLGGQFEIVGDDHHRQARWPATAATLAFPPPGW